MRKQRRYITRLNKTYERRYLKIIKKTIEPLIKGSKELLKSDLYKQIRITDSRALTIEQELEKLYHIIDLGQSFDEQIRELLLHMFHNNIKKFNKFVDIDTRHIFLTTEEQELLEDTIIFEKGLIENLALDYKAKAARILIDGYQNGTNYKTLSEEIQKAINTSYSRAETIAITELAKANERVNRERIKEAGFTKVRWSTARDDRVRKCHRAREGQEFYIDKGCYNSCDGKYLRVGQEVRCRCAYLLVIDDIEKEGVYR